MNPVNPNEPECGVVDGDLLELRTETMTGPSAGWESRFTAIDERVHYVGPVLEDILLLDHDAWPGSFRE